jgi:uncharacterized protein (DUF433 family)
MTRNELLNRISINPQVCFGKPCIKGRRIWVSLVLDFLASGMSVESIMEEYDLDGNLVQTVSTVGGPVDLHDVILLPSGNYVLATAQNQPCDLSSWGFIEPKICVNHVFQELTTLCIPVWTWDTSAHIQVDETTPPWRGPHPLIPDVYDPWHYNSVEFTGDGFIISFRHLDAIYKIEGLAKTSRHRWFTVRQVGQRYVYRRGDNIDVAIRFAVEKMGGYIYSRLVLAVVSAAVAVGISRLVLEAIVYAMTSTWASAFGDIRLAVPPAHRARCRRRPRR